jgi:amino acid transporter
VASRHPLEGSLYAWAGRLLGPAYGWFTGWAYMWTVLIALVTVAVGATQFWGAALAIDVSAKSSLIVGSIIVLAFATASNLLSRRVLRMMIALSIAAEVIGSVGLGITLLLFYDVNSIGTVFDNGGNGWTMSALLLGAASPAGRSWASRAPGRSARRSRTRAATSRRRCATRCWRSPRS